MDKKRLLEILTSLFIAAIFLSGYLAYGGGGSSSANATTTLSNVPTVYANARTSALITSYGSGLNLNIACANVSSVSKHASSILTSLESNGTVSTFYAQQAQISVQTGTANSSGVYKLLYKGLNASSLCTQFYGSTEVQVPGTITFNLPLQKTTTIVIIPSSKRTYQISLMLLPNMGSKVNVTLATLLTLNGTIYGNVTIQEA